MTNDVKIMTNDVETMTNDVETMTNDVETMTNDGRIESRQNVQLVKNPSLTIIRCSSNELMVRMGSRSRVSKQIKDDGRRGILAAVAERFALPQSVGEMTDQIEGVTAEDLAEVIDFLRDNDVLVEVGAAESSFLSLGLGLGDTSMLATRHVGIVGSDRIATAAAEQLADAGVGRFSLVGTPDDDAAERRSALTELGASVELLSAEEPSGGALVDLFEAADLVLVLSSELDLSLAYSCNSVALQLETPWVLAHADGPSLVVGPLFRPNETACFNDFDTQEEAGRTLLMEHLFYKSQLMANGLQHRELPRFVTDLGASLVTVAAVQALCGRHSVLDGAVLRYDLERLEVVREAVMRLPRCPACLAGDPDYRHPFL